MKEFITRDLRHSPLPSLLLVAWCRSLVFLPGLDKGLGLAAVVDLDVDLGILIALVSEALEVAAVAQQVEGEAESQHAQRQQTHVHLKTTRESDQHNDSSNV